MKKLLAIVIIVALVLPGMAVVSAQDGSDAPRTGFRPDAPPYGVRGPYPVGTMELVIDDAERPLPVTVWYPALNPDGAEEMTQYDMGVEDIFGPLNFAPGHALLDANPDVASGPYPLVVNSHGTGATRYFQAFMMEHLASYGFVVMAPEHLGTAMRDSYTAPPDGEQIFGLPAQDFVDGHYLRPVDMQRVILFADELTGAGGAFEGVIDTEHIALTGYSGGGYTALAAAGAQLDFAALNAWCAQDGISEETNPGYEMSCALPAYEADLAALFGGEMGALLPAVTDPRVDAVVAFSPGRVPAFGPDGLAALTVPTMVLTGSADMTDWQDDNAYVAYAQMGSADKALIVFDYGGHMLFGACPDSWLGIAFGVCADQVWDMARAHDLTDHFVTAFLLAELYGDEDAAAALAPEAMQFPGITYETTEY